MLQLKKLSVKNCRGIVNGPDLCFGSGGVLICGDNGTGKSSYVDALEKVLTGKCSSLDIHTQGLSWRQQGSHINAESDPEIDLEITDGNNTHVINLKSSLTSIHHSLKPFLHAAQEGGFILRRRTMLDFINARPADRWRAVETILNIDDFRKFEQKLIDLNTDLQSRKRCAEGIIQDNEKEIREKLDIDSNFPINESNCVRRINEILRSLGLAELSSLNEIENASATIQEQISAFSDVQKWQKMLQFDEILRREPPYQDLIASLSSYANLTRKLNDETNKLAGNFYEEVLKCGLKWILDDKLVNCPLCGSPIAIDKVNSYVKQRLEEHTTIIKLKAERDTLRADFHQKISIYASYLDGLNEYLGNGGASPYTKKYEQFRNKIRKIKDSHVSIQNIDAIHADLAYLQDPSNQALISSIRQYVNEKCTSSPDIKRYNNLYNLKRHFQTIPVHLHNIRDAQKCIGSCQHCQTQTAHLCNLATQARKNSVQLLMSAISNTADELYQSIHPGESIGSPEIFVRQQTTASLELKSDFYGISGDPRGHYSEGHVDSLGLCIFLAIRRFQYQKCSDVALLVLDDVLHSVDGDHRRATAEMIFEKFNDHQLFITTHDPIWYEYLKSASNRSTNRKKIEYYKISDWTLREGPVFGDHLNDYEWLTSERCDKATPQDKTAKAGRLLEAMLQDLCHNLSINVPYHKTGNYNIGDLWGPFYSKAIQFKGFGKVAEPCLKKIEQTRTLRNWSGAHWNEWASGITNAEAQEFCDAVLELRNLVYCDSCGLFIKRISDLDGVWACKRQHLKYEKNE